MLGKRGTDVLRRVGHKVLDAGKDLLEHNRGVVLGRNELTEPGDLGCGGGAHLCLVVAEKGDVGGDELLFCDLVSECDGDLGKKLKANSFGCLHRQSYRQSCSAHATTCRMRRP